MSYLHFFNFLDKQEMCPFNNIWHLFIRLTHDKDLAHVKEEFGDDVLLHSIFSGSKAMEWIQPETKKWTEVQV